MALSRTQQIELWSLLHNKLKGSNQKDSDEQIAAWMQSRLIASLPDESQESLYDELLQETIDNQIEQRDAASAHFNTNISVLEEKKRTP